MASQTVAPKQTDYETWSSSQLIERIKLLESQIPSQSSPQPPKSQKPEAKRYILYCDVSNNRTAKQLRPFDFDKHPTRYIAIKYAYLGWHYHGLAYSDPTIPTVELELFKALEKVKLIKSPETCNYSRCGRTDAGVSAMGQVSAFIARSNISPEDRIENGGRGYSIDSEGKSKGEELDYVQLLNWVLPPSIRVIGWTPVPHEFDARFSCRGRHYRYFFTNLEGELDISAMNIAAKHFLGENDFRNFCKLDVQKQITNFNRKIEFAEISPYKGQPPNSDSKIWTLELKGTAFLWHQVRCMMAILFLVGQHLENPEIVKDLLNIEKYPQRPDYEMAHDVPLVLYDCEFEGLEWRYPSDGVHSKERILASLFSGWHDLKLQETIAGLFCTSFGRSETIRKGIEKEGGISIWRGSGFPRNSTLYKKVEKRQRLEAYEVTNERYLKSAKYEKHQRKQEGKAKLLENNSQDDIMEQR